MDPSPSSSSSTSNDSLLKFLAWLEQNKKRVALISSVVVVVVGLIAAIVYYQSQKEVRASEALSDVRVPFNPTTPTPPGTVEAYLKVAQDYEGTTAAGRALLEAGSLLYIQGKYPEAEARYKQFLSEYPESPFLQQGMLGLASALDAEGKPTEAIAKYEELRRRFPTDSVIDETKLALGRLYEKQNPADAVKLYTELTALGSQSGVGSEAGIRLADLMEKHPELAKTNAPPAPMTPPQPKVPQASITRTPPTNRVVMAITNLQNQPSTTITIPAPSATATSAVVATPPQLPSTPAVTTNKP